MAAMYSTVTALGGALLVLVILRKLMTVRRYLKGVALLKDKVVLITGASSGLGEACAHAFYKAGCRLILCARRTDQLERVKNDLQRLAVVVRPHEPKILTFDLADTGSIQPAIETAIGFYGRVDVVVNNGGVSSRGRVEETSIDVDVAVMNVNYFGQVAVTKCLLPQMLSRGGGHIVAVGSIQGKLALPYRAAYGASKHALQSFCDSLRAEVAQRGVALTMINPGYIRTNLSLNALTSKGTAYGKMDVTQESGMTPEAVADGILRAVALRQTEVLLAPLTFRLAVYLRNLLPAVYHRVMSARAVKQSNLYKKQT